MGNKKPKKTRLNAIDRIDSIRLCMDHGIDLQNRTLSLTGAVNDDMYEAAVSGFAVLNQLQVPSITLRLNTPGGDLYSGLALYDLVKANKTPIDIIAVGICMSAGALIMQAGRKRLATPNTQLLVHYGSDAASGTYKDFQRYAEHGRNLEIQIADIFCNRCNWSDETYAELNAHDTYLNAKQAVGRNLIDGII